MIIQNENITAPDVLALLTEHVQDMQSSEPAESGHILDLSALYRPSISFYTPRTAEGELQGCGTTKELSLEHAELKSMRTCQAHLRKGVARNMTLFLIQEARVLT
ncbi:hypothetical protein EK21DRAFT_85864 [Setomelanomma holmii]|uniref:Uncharacterized protein n=1 Tax=Setomelanomma holmii TaxID=210430 RepID=A0A9P4HGY4_9PLEO|nr:hypothetical protein EK21DRAFT_85864 [Setomelanomma holmii]